MLCVFSSCYYPRILCSFLGSKRVDEKKKKKKKQEEEEEGSRSTNAMVHIILFFHTYSRKA